MPAQPAMASPIRNPRSRRLTDRASAPATSNYDTILRSYIEAPISCMRLLGSEPAPMDTAHSLPYVDLRGCSRGGPRAALRAAQNGGMHAYI